MGTSTSKTSPLMPAFARMATWDLKAARQLLQDYKDKDMDFGLDAQGLAELLQGDKEWAEAILDAFGTPTGIVNALAFICGACLVSIGPALGKAEIIFEALDFDGTEQISMDEMTISFLCCTRGYCVMSGVGTVPTDEDLESITLQSYRDLNKGSTQSISKSEFTKWVVQFAGGEEAPSTHEVTLQNVLEQFRVVPPSTTSEVGQENNDLDLLQDIEEKAAIEQVAGNNDLPTEQDAAISNKDTREIVPSQRVVDEPTDTANETDEQTHEMDASGLDTLPTLEGDEHDVSVQVNQEDREEEAIGFEEHNPTGFNKPSGEVGEIQDVDATTEENFPVDSDESSQAPLEEKAPAQSEFSAETEDRVDSGTSGVFEEQRVYTENEAEEDVEHSMPTDTGIIELPVDQPNNVLEDDSTYEQDFAQETPLTENKTPDVPGESAEAGTEIESAPTEPNAQAFESTTPAIEGGEIEVPVRSDQDLNTATDEPFPSGELEESTT